MSELSDEDEQLLASLEAEGLLSKGLAKRVRAGLRVANAAGAVRTRVTAMIALLVLASVLAAVQTAAPFDWLKVLCGCLIATCLVCALGTLISLAP
jgi:hypothetical protein